MASLKHVAGWCAEAWPKWSAHALSFATCWMKAFVEGDEIRSLQLRVSELQESMRHRREIFGNFWIFVLLKICDCCSSRCFFQVSTRVGEDKALNK